ncbi:MAG TPA: M48 family metallopeptidase, partial [Nitratifractor sp.]|nr:M48 family metallopeptidase [Nitratifractor sp.]
MTINAKMYDGKSSKEHSVAIEITQNGRFKIASHGIDLALEDVTISSRLGDTPRLIHLPDGTRCKSEENDTIDRALSHFSLQSPLVHKLERSWKFALGALAVIVITITLSLTVGADFTAKMLAKNLPQNSLDSASRNTLKMLDKHYLHKSNLSNEKKAKILHLFQKLTDGEKRYKLHFRSSPAMGANAFALPNGDIVLIDSLVYLDKDPNLYGILGVLAHEKGHVVYKHGLQGLIKGAIVATVIGYATGDLSFITTALPTMLLTSKYSREFETQADSYAKMQLHKMGISTKPLANLFLNIENFANKKSKGKSSENRFPWLASHPITSKRVAYFN